MRRSPQRVARHFSRTLTFCLIVRTCISPACAAGAPDVELRGHPAPTRLVLPMPIEPARTAVKTLLQELTDSNERRRYRLVFNFGDPLFPPATDIAENAQQRGALGEIVGWLQLPTTAKSRDLLITPDVDYFWPVDYYAGSQRVGFSTAFILHFAQSGPTSSTIDILQINSFVRLGKHFDLLGRTGPKFYWDDRAAAPSPQAARDLATLLARNIAH